MKQISLVILAVFIGLSAFAQTPTNLRADAVRLASRGYFNKSIDCLRQIPTDSLKAEDMLMYPKYNPSAGEDALMYYLACLKGDNGENQADIRQQCFAVYVFADYIRFQIV